MATKSLKQLLDRADAFIAHGSSGSGLAKEAASNQDDVSALVELLLSADTISSEPQTTQSQEEFEKTALSLNRLQAASEIADLVKVAHFCKLASQEGFAEEQIQEAVMKIAASRLLKNLPALTSMGVISNLEDKNALPVKQKSSKAPEKDLVESQGY